MIRVDLEFCLAFILSRCLIRERIRLEQRIEERESLNPKSPSNLSKSEMATASLSPISPVFSISTSPKSPITTSTPTPPTVWHQTRSYSSLRRQILHGLALSPLILIKETAISEAKEVEVGSYLPPSSSDPSFVLFKATPKDTPALRAGCYL